MNIVQYIIDKGNVGTYKSLLVSSPLCCSSVNKAILKAWLVVIHRWNKRLLQLKCEEIVNILLYNIGWLSTNLSDLYHLYEKYVIDVVACSPVHINPFIQHLMRHVLIIPQLGKRKHSEEDDAKKQVGAIFDIYKKKMVGEYVLEGRDYEFMYKLLQHHPKAREKLTKLSKISVMRNESHSSSSIGFFVVSSEGKKEEISYLKCIDNLALEKMNDSIASLEEQYKSKHANIVKMLCKIVCTFPLVARNVLNSIKSYFPYKTASISEQYLYFKTCIDLAQTCPYLSEEIVYLCWEKMMLIEADLKYSRMDKIVSKQELHEHMSYTKETQSYPIYQKANILMELLFKQIEDTLSKSPNINTCDMYLRIFDEVILNTYKTRCTQYLILYAAKCDKSNDLLQKFISLLILNTFNTNRKHNKEITINYIASLLSAYPLQKQILEEAVNIILDMYYQYTKKHPHDKTMTPLFMQALAYIICYKYDVLKGTKALEQMEQIIFTNSIEPIEYSILDELLKIYSTNEKVTCEIIKAQDKNTTRLRAYFPFAKHYVLNSINVRFGDFNIYTCTQK